MARLSNAIYERLAPLTQILKNTVRDMAPVHLKPFIHVELHKRGDTPVIEVSIDAKEDPAPRFGSADALAQEFGSGLRAQIGETGFIRFGAKEAQALVFPGTHEWEGQTIVMRKPNKVNHPGINAANRGQGYIRPAIRELEGTIINSIDPTVRDEVNFEIRTVFKHAKRLR